MFKVKAVKTIIYIYTNHKNSHSPYMPYSHEEIKHKVYPRISNFLLDRCYSEIGVKLFVTTELLIIYLLYQKRGFEGGYIYFNFSKQYIHQGN